MRIALLGYGKMGKTIAHIIETEYNNKHNISMKINSQNTQQLNAQNLNQHADVAIEFSQPNTVLNHIKICFEANIPIIVGTTGWQNQQNTVEQWCKNANGTLLYASNFSIGVNLFFLINSLTAKIMSHVNNYSLQINEIHHTQKLDAPSGTAISLANQIIKANPNKTQWVNYPSNNPSQVPIISIREQDVKGTHIINYQSDIDTITLAHSAHSRLGFAKGAITAAEWIKNKKGFYHISDMINNLYPQLF